MRMKYAAAILLIVLSFVLIAPAAEARWYFNVGYDSGDYGYDYHPGAYGYGYAPRYSYYDFRPSYGYYRPSYYTYVPSWRRSYNLPSWTSSYNRNENRNDNYNEINVDL